MKKQTSAFVQWLTQPINFLLLMISLVPMYFVALFMHTYTVNMPTADQWDLGVRLAFKTVGGDFSWGLLLEDWNGHRVVFTNLVTILSAFLLNWQPKTEVYVTLAVGVVGFGLLMGLCWRSLKADARWLLVPLSALCFSLVQTDIWITSSASGAVFYNTFFYACLLLIQTQPLRWQTLLGAILLALLATFSYGSGLLIWISLAVVLWVKGYRHPLYLAAWAAGAAASTWVYFWGGTADRQFAEVSLRDLPHIIRFLLAYFGSPLSFSAYDIHLAVGIGAVVLLLATINILYVWRRERRLDDLIIWLALMAHAFGVGILVILTRFEPSGAQALQNRYVISSSLLWIALLVLMAKALRELRQSGEKGWLLGSNLLFAALCVPFYLQANLATLSGISQEYARLMLYHHTAAPYPEVCIVTTPLTDAVDCMYGLPYGGFTNATTVYQLAAYRMAVFAHQKPQNILPATYQAGSPILIDTSDIWLNSYLSQMWLGNPPESALFHIVGSSGSPYNIPLPRPIERVVTDISQQSLEQITAFTENAEQVWYFNSPQAVGHGEVIETVLAQQGFVPIFAPLPPDFGGYRLTRFQQLPEHLSDLYFFNENLSLQAFSLDRYSLPARNSPSKVGGVWRVMRLLTALPPTAPLWCWLIIQARPSPAPMVKWQACRWRCGKKNGCTWMSVN